MLDRQLTVLDSKPRQERGKFWILTFLTVIVSVQTSYIILTSDNAFQELYDYLGILMFPLIPTLTVVYLLHWYRAGSMKQFNDQFCAVNKERKVAMNMFAVLVFIIWFQGSDKVSMMVTYMVSMTPALALFLWLKLHRNNVEDDEKISRSKYHIGPGLATAYFSFIENTIKGVVTDDGRIISKSYLEAKHDYKKENHLADRDWISEKIVILFLESELHKGGIMDIKKIEKNKGEEHSVVLDNLTQNYDANGQPRESVLNVVRIKTNKKEEEVPCSKRCSKDESLKEIKKDRGYFSQQSEEFTRVQDLSEKQPPQPPSCAQTHRRLVDYQNSYVVIAENRPLMALFEMRNLPDNKINFSQSDYELQYKLYYEEFKQLIESNPVTSKHVKLFHYLDGSSEGEFSVHLKHVIDEIKK